MENDTPGIDGKKFLLLMDKEVFAKNDLITWDRRGETGIVTKVYRMTWWKKLLRFLWIKRTWFIGVQVNGVYWKEGRKIGEITEIIDNDRPTE